jgi:hypothetical protein
MGIERTPETWEPYQNAQNARIGDFFCVFQFSQMDSIQLEQRRVLVAEQLI